MGCYMDEPSSAMERELAIERQAKWDDRFVKLAEHVAGWSKDPSTKVGAVIVDGKRRVVSVGYNGLPRGVTDTDERLQDRAVKLRMTIHGEINAILFAKAPLDGCILYTWPFMSCSACAAVVIQSGIRRVVAPVMPESVQPRWGDDCRLARSMFDEAGVEVCILG